MLIRRLHGTVLDEQKRDTTGFRCPYSSIERRLPPLAYRVSLSRPRCQPTVFVVPILVGLRYIFPATAIPEHTKNVRETREAFKRERRRPKDLNEVRVVSALAENLDAFLDRRNYFYCGVIVERYRAEKAFLPTEYSNVSFSRNSQIFSLKEEYASIDYICRLAVEKRYPSFRIDK